MNENKGKIIGVMAALAVVVFGAVGGGVVLTKNIGKSAREVSREEALKDLPKMLKKIDVTTVEPRKAQVQIGTGSLADELPDINKYPLSVTGNGDIDIEIFSSTEKSGKGTDGWLNEVAKNFNSEHFDINGRLVSVSVRPVASGLSVDYIVSGKHVPQAYTPSNDLWGAMVEAEDVEINLVAEKLVGNTAGILVNKDTYSKISKQYGDVNIDTIVKATVDGTIAMGYTNPYASATGLNFLVSALHSFDNKDMLSEQSVKSFIDFQMNVPFVAYTTLQMRDAAESGALDAFILEYQTVYNDPSLKGYEFIPFGVEHNNPLYSVGFLSNEEEKAIDMFAEYCLNDQSQRRATEYGFNQKSYKSDLPKMNGNTLVSAQKLWKEEKDAGKPVIAVFVADTSGSMAGDPIVQLKRSLINASQYIGEDNYIGLVTYNSDVQINLPIDKFDINHRAYFTGAVEDLNTLGSTATYDAVMVATNMLLEAHEEHPEAKLMMFVLSDGETNVGHSLKQISGVVKALDIPVCTIGYNANLNELGKLSAINEAPSINADSDDVVYSLKNLFNAQV